MWISGQWFGLEVVEQIAATVKATPTISRRELSRRVCGWLEWRAPNGTLRELSCRKALQELARRGHVELPAYERVSGFSSREVKSVEPPEVAEVVGLLPELGAIEVVPVSTRYSKMSGLWKGMLDAYHYLGSGPLCGAQIRYVVRCANYGWIGGVSFSAATPRLQARDQWIGWSDRARRANLEQVVCNSRFLIVPSVQVPNLASRILSLCARRIGTDWHQRYGYEPALLETFVDGQQFAGTCYRAANWQHVGHSAGRRDGYANGTVSTGQKEIFLYPLARDWRQRLCQEPADPLVLRFPIRGAEEWVHEEFAGARLGDERLRQRLYTLAQDFLAQPGKLIPQACQGLEAKSKAAYRFFRNKGVDMQALLKGHVEATAQRVRTHNVVLAVQDTTTLNYTAHPSTEGLGPINTTKDHAVGLLVHDTMSFSLDGTPLGLLDVQCWARDPKAAGQKATRKSWPIEQKESVKWLRSYQAVAEVQALCPETMLVSVGDREADIHELFLHAQQCEGGPKLLVRSERSRHRQVLGTEQADVWEKLAAEPVAGHLAIQVPRSGSRVARTAKLAVRTAAVTLKCPTGKALDPVHAWAIYAREVEADATVHSPLEWLLLTTVPTSSFEQAVERLRWYTLRWGIEVYHRVLKSGCRLEDRQLGEAARLETCLAIDLVVAWRIFWLVKQGRETPQVPCTVFFKEEEWQTLCAVVSQDPPPDTPPTLREAVRMTAKLGDSSGARQMVNPAPSHSGEGSSDSTPWSLATEPAGRLPSAFRSSVTGRNPRSYVWASVSICGGETPHIIGGSSPKRVGKS